MIQAKIKNSVFNIFDIREFAHGMYSFKVMERPGLLYAASKRWLDQWQ